LPKTITAIFQQNHRYTAIKLRKKKHHEYEMLASDNGSTKDVTWKAFCQQSASLPADTISAKNGNSSIIAGFDSIFPAYYRITLPELTHPQTEAAIMMQAESLLPLPVDQMEITWRKNFVENGMVDITILAARKDQLQGIKRQCGECMPGKIILQAEAITKAWRTFYNSNDDQAVVIYIDQYYSYVCHCQSGRLIEGYNCDVGLRKLTGSNELNSNVAEQLSQDIYHCVERFAGKDKPLLSIYFITDQSDLIDQTINYLADSELDIIPALLKDKTFSSEIVEHEAMPAEEVLYQNLIPIGMAITSLDGDEETFNLFKQINKSDSDSNKKRKITPVKLAAGLMAALVLLAIGVSYYIDIAQLRKLDEYLQANKDKYNVVQLLNEKNTKVMIGAQRADILDLLVLVNSCDPKEIELDSLNCVKGQPVTLNARTKNKEKLYEFFQNLEKLEPIKKAGYTIRQTPSKNGKICFTFCFDYKLFAKKKK